MPTMPKLRFFFSLQPQLPKQLSVRNVAQGTSVYYSVVEMLGGAKSQSNIYMTTPGVYRRSIFKIGGLLKGFMRVNVGYGSSVFDFGIKINIIKEKLCLLGFALFSNEK